MRCWLVSEEQPFRALLICRAYALLTQKKKAKYYAFSLSWTTHSYWLPGERKMPNCRCKRSRWEAWPKKKHVLDTTWKHKPDCSGIQTWRADVPYHSTSVLTADRVYTDPLQVLKSKLWETRVAEQKRVSMANWTKKRVGNFFPGVSHITHLEGSMTKPVVLRSPGTAMRAILMSPFSPGESISPSFTVGSNLSFYSMQGFNHFAGRRKIIQSLSKYSIFKHSDLFSIKMCR